MQADVAPTELLGHTAGNLFRTRNVCSGDTVYVVTVRNGCLIRFHLCPVSSLANDTKVNPQTDMTVVCSNCHRMLGYPPPDLH